MSHTDETTGSYSVLERYFGVAAVKLIFRMGWQPGQRLVYNPIFLEAENCNDTFRTLSQETHPQMWLTLAGTLASKGNDLCDRLQRHEDGRLKPVLLTLVDTVEATGQHLTWPAIPKALVEMTAFHFSDCGILYEWDDQNGSCEQENFEWGYLHDRLSQRTNLPLELQRGMDVAKNGDKWTNTMAALLAEQTRHWKENPDSSRQYLKHIGTLWKTLEVAINNANMSLDLCVFFCKQVMDALWWADGGSMSFTPSLKPSSASSASSAQVCSFEPRVRYRAQGTKPDKRYPGTVTWTQAHNLFLSRPFFAASGVLPASSARGHAVAQ